MNQTFLRALGLLSMPAIGFAAFCLSYAFSDYAGNIDAAIALAVVAGSFIGAPVCMLCEQTPV